MVRRAATVRVQSPPSGGTLPVGVVMWRLCVLPSIASHPTAASAWHRANRISAISSARCSALWLGATAAAGTTVLGASVGSMRGLKTHCEHSPSKGNEGEGSRWLPDPINKFFSTAWLDFSARYAQVTAELSQEPGSLYRTIVDKDRFDAEANPEIEWRAKVRLGTETCIQERAFLRDRKAVIRKDFAQLIGVPESEVDERDIPVIAFAASGGGYRAMTSTTGALRGARSLGVLDVTSYISAISGSCWAVALWLSLAGGDLDKLQAHIKKRTVTPFLDFSNLQLFVDEPTNKYLLSGAILKGASKGGTTSLVDIYGTLVASRLFVPEDLSGLSPAHLKISAQKHLIEGGAYPMPIYCAIRHEVPEIDKLMEVERSRIETQIRSKTLRSRGGDEAKELDKKEEVLARERDKLLGRQSYQWLEVTPWEFGCEEWGAFIPTWSLGRLFESGRDVEPQPELSLTILSGIFASAFTATLAHYYKEVKPALVTLPFFKAIDSYISSFNSNLAILHPFPPAELPNPFKGLDGDLRPGTPAAITEASTLGLMDAGAELNIPYVPLYRRGCDVIFALDASADSQDLWFEKAGEYAQKAGLEGWPKVEYRGPFPQAPSVPVDGESENDPQREKESAEARGKVTEAAEQAGEERNKGTGEARESLKKANPYPADSDHSAAEAETEREPALGRVNIWVGDSKHEGSARMDDPKEEEVMQRDGPVLIYLPLVPGNGLNSPADLWSTWRFDYSEEQTEQLMKLSEDNFLSGKNQIVKTLRAVWKRKRQQRLRRADS